MDTVVSTLIDYVGGPDNARIGQPAIVGRDFQR